MREQQRNRVAVLIGGGLFTEMLAQVLERHGYRCHVIEAGALSSTAIVSAVVTARPDVVIASLDLRSRHSDGGVVLATLAQAGHRVLAVVEDGGPSRRGKALALGAHAVATTTMPLNEFLAAVRKTMHGVQVIERHERMRLIASYREQEAEREAANSRLESLTAHERDILAHLMTGRGVREIARLRVVSEHTVRTQVRAILAKLGVSSQVEAVVVAWRTGWCTPSDSHRMERPGRSS